MKFLVIGAGKAGTRHATNLRNLGHDVRLEDKPPTPDWRSYFASDFAWRGTDAAVVATPPSTHYELAEQAWRHGLPVLVEKPVFDRVWPGMMLPITPLVMPVTNYRFHPSIRALKREIEDGDLGDLIGLRAEYCEPLSDWQPSYECDPWLEAGVHLADYTYWLMGGWAVHGKPIQRWRGKVVSSLDAGLVSIFVGWAGSGYHHRVTAFGTEAMRSYDLQPSVEMHYAQLKHFIACIEGTEQPICPVAEAIEILSRLL